MTKTDRVGDTSWQWMRFTIVLTHIGCQKHISIVMDFEIMVIPQAIFLVPWFAMVSNLWNSLNMHSAHLPIKLCKFTSQCSEIFIIDFPSWKTRFPLYQHLHLEFRPIPVQENKRLLWFMFYVIIMSLYSCQKIYGKLFQWESMGSYG